MCGANFRLRAKLPLKKNRRLKRRVWQSFVPLGVPACLVIYVGALDFLQAPFVISTIALVVVLGMLLSKPTLRMALIFALFGLVLSVSINLVFTHFLFVDLG